MNSGRLTPDITYDEMNPTQSWSDVRLCDVYVLVELMKAKNASRFKLSAVSYIYNLIQLDKQLLNRSDPTTFQPHYLFI